MSLESLVSQFGYIALIVGLMLEGETILIMAAFLAHRGHLELSWVILISILVEFLSGQFFFRMGATQGSRYLEAQPKMGRNMEKAKSLLERNTSFIFLAYQFMYGFRIIIPFVSGMNKANYRKFSILNLTGIILWSLLYGITGYLFGHVVEIILQDVERYEFWIILGLALIGSMIWLYRNRNHLFMAKAGNDE